MKKDNLEFDRPVLIFRNDCGDHSYVCYTTTRHGGVSSGEYGSFNLGAYCGDDPDHVRQNRNLLCEILDVDPALLFVPRQVHGDGIVVIDEGFLSSDNFEKEPCLPDCDALITSLDHICLGVTTADCVPVVFYSDDPSVIAVAHAGWRGTAKKIAARVVAEMSSVYGCRPEKIYAVIYSSISKEVYEVGADVVRAIEETEIDMSGVAVPGKSPEHYYLDLVLANRRQLMLAGLPDSHVEAIGDCTYTRNKDLFSARKQGIASGRILSGIIKRKRNYRVD